MTEARTQPVWLVSSENLIAFSPALMGIVNVTPDSFFDGGQFGDEDAAVAQGVRLVEEGAVIVDVGGESSRPGAKSLTPEEEILRVRPVIQRLVEKGIRVSIDTYHPQTAEAALAAGAVVVNDISAGRGLVPEDEGRMFEVIKKFDASLVLMHMQGTPRNMQNDPRYVNCVEEVLAFLKDRVAVAKGSGIPRERIAVDPGIGFGKRLEDNLALIRDLGRFHETGCAVLLGASRKSFIGTLTGAESEDRLPGSLVAAIEGARRGANLLRVHDVFATHQALRVAEAIRTE